LEQIDELIVFWAANWAEDGVQKRNK